MKCRKLTIRITENQFKILCDNILEEGITKSNYIRNLIEMSEQFYRKDLIDVIEEKKSKNKLLNILKGIK
jgi:hypothetical protein